MSTRSFTVFQDLPSTPPASSPCARSETPSSPSIPAPVTVLPSNAEKENVHPLTGERARQNAAVAGKKRKTGVLATKLHVVLSVKDSAPQTKKRKSASSFNSTSASSSTHKGRTSVKKSSSRKASSSRVVRKVSPLPKLDEEAEAEKDKEQKERKSQAEIDAKCYELTVLPLANVTSAYEECPTPVVAPVDEKNKPRTVKEPSAEPELRDYYAPSLTSSVSKASTGSSTTPDESKTFSTPERRRIYAAFTFSSPSPSAERFSKSSHSTRIRLDFTKVSNPQ